MGWVHPVEPWFIWWIHWNSFFFSFPSSRDFARHYHLLQHLPRRRTDFAFRTCHPVTINPCPYLAHRSGSRALRYLARCRRSVNETAPCLVTESPKGIESLIRRADDIRSSSRVWRECSFNLRVISEFHRGTTVAQSRPASFSCTRWKAAAIASVS